MKQKVEIDEYGNKRWQLNGKFHREDGPAIEGANGDKEWWINGRILTKEEWFDSLSPEAKDKLLFSEHFIKE